MIEFSHAGFMHAGADAPALTDVSLSVGQGERVVVLGANGSGKSTLARMATGSLVASTGLVSVDGVACLARNRNKVARLVASVRQDPAGQLVSDLVFDEVAFGPQNLGLGRESVSQRVSEALAAAGISRLADRLTSELSGGQQQLVALAGALAMKPRYLVLDEVASHLDGHSRRLVEHAVSEAVASGVGVLEVSHGVSCLPGASRVVVLEGGRVVWEGTPVEFLLSRRGLEASGLMEDPLARVLSIAVANGFNLGTRLEGDELAAFLSTHGLARRSAAQLERPTRVDGAKPGHILSLASVVAGYGGRAVVSGVTISSRGTLTVVGGRSASGKTTLARVLSGLLEPSSGSVTIDGRQVRPGMVGLAFQRPEDQLFADTVFDDIACGPTNLGMAPERVGTAVRDAARELGISDDLLRRSPFELSGGQMRRVALAGIWSMGLPAIVLDEPTAGLDVRGRRLLREAVCARVRQGVSVVVFSHDLGEWLPIADEVVLLSGGRVSARIPGRTARTNAAPFLRAGLEPPAETLVWGAAVREARGGARG